MDRLLTLKETGKLLNVSKQTLQRWDNSGKLIAIRTEGGHRRYKLSDIEKILKQNRNVTDNEIIEATKLIYEFDFGKYITNFTENEINIALGYAKMCDNIDNATWAFLGFLDGINFNKTK